MSRLGLDAHTAHRCSWTPRWKDNQELWRKEANRRSFPWRGQSLRYRLDRWPPLQANTPKLPVLHSTHNLLVPPGSDVRSVLPDGHVISSRHAGWGGSGWIDLPCPLQSVRQRHALTLAPRRVSPLRGWHGSHSHVPQADAARQLPGVLPQRPSTVVERMENRHKCFQEQRDDIRACRTALHPAPTSHTLRGTNPMGRNY